MNREAIKSRVEGYREELLHRLSALVAIASVQGEAQADAPFGAQPAKALDTALEMLRADGFKTVNLDHYAGYAEIGEGEKLIGVVGHLDVVPADKADGWTYDPFKMTEKDGVLYGRGVSDDKGAVVASMIALNVIKDAGIPLKKRIRLIMGTNEETGSRGLQYYVEKEGHVDLGFTPDGDFPAIHGEKGMISATYRSKETSIRSIQGGAARNIVCAKVTCTVDKNTFSNKKLSDYFNNNDVRYELKENEETADITVFGKAAHASLPKQGINAISHLFAALRSAGLQDPFVEFYTDHFGVETNGASLCGTLLQDDYGELTLNNGMITMHDGVIEGSIDIRFPVTMSARQVLKAMEEHLEDENGSIHINSTVEPLFFPLDSPLVSCLAGAYADMTGDHEHQPLVIGGGTYAKEIHNTIAFGCAFPGNDYHIHDVDEWVRIDELLLQAEIYVEGLCRLLEI